MTPRKAPRLARTGSTSPFGKLDDRVESFRISSPVKAELQRKANAAGVPLGEYMREVCDILAFGADHVKSMQAQRIDRVASMLGIR